MANGTTAEVIGGNSGQLSAPFKTDGRKVWVASRIVGS